MAGGYFRTYGVKKAMRVYVLTHCQRFWDFVAGINWLASRVNRSIINSSIYTMQTRPLARSTKSDYVTWDSLRDTKFSQRHLPPDKDLIVNDRPQVSDLRALFKRDGDGALSEHTSLLFPLFAQWFVDGFLRTDPTNVLKNTSTHDIDLSQLYGQTPDVTAMLRTGSGGRLKSQIINGQEFPPYYIDDHGSVKLEFANLPIAPLDTGDRKVRDGEYLAEEVRRKLFALGIPRGNIHYGFAMLSTLFLREHNRIADEIGASAEAEQWDDERVFQTTRNTMIVLLIKIVIEDYINHITPIKFPLFVEEGIGVNERWYRQNWMSVEFNLLYRWHTLVPTWVELAGDTRRFSELRWDTHPVTEFGISALLDEASTQHCGTIGLFNTDESLLDIEEISIKIGRKAELQSFNEYRRACDLPALGSIGDLTSDPKARAGLEECYPEGIDKVELFVGLFAEDVRKGSLLPPVMSAMVAVDAFSQALTNPLLAPGIFDDDNTFSKVGREAIRTTSKLADVVKRNIKGEMPDPKVSLAYQR